MKSVQKYNLFLPAKRTTKGELKLKTEKLNIRNIPLSKKEELYTRAFPIIDVIHTLGNDMMLRSQLRQLTCATYHITEKQADFLISEMLSTGLLYRKPICSDSKTELLYLSKFVIGKLTNTTSADVPAIAFSRRKIYENIFNTEYLCKYLLPELTGKYETNPDNIIAYLKYVGSNMLIPSHQLYYSDYFQIFYIVCNRLQLSLTDDFFYDWKAYHYDKLKFLSKSDTSLLEECNLYKEEKKIRESICQTYTSDIERVKYTYSLANMMAGRFHITSLTENCINLIYNDSLDSLTLDKLYLNLAGLVLMFDRYIKKELTINLTVFVWSEQRAQNFYSLENKCIYDSFTRTYKDIPRSEAYLANYGIKPSFWENINVHYVPMDISNKYQVFP